MKESISPDKRVYPLFLRGKLHSFFFKPKELHYAKMRFYGTKEFWDVCIVDDEGVKYKDIEPIILKKLHEPCEAHAWEHIFLKGNLYPTLVFRCFTSEEELMSKRERKRR